MESDLPFLVGFLEQLFAIEEDFTFSRDTQLKGLEMLAGSASSAIMVAEDSSRIIGMVTGQLLISTAEGGRCLLIEDLFVKTEARGQGIGRKLLQAIGKWGFDHGAKRMQLLADRDNLPALDFYAKSGWMQTKLICLRRYFSENDL